MPTANGAGASRVGTAIVGIVGTCIRRPSLHRNLIHASGPPGEHCRIVLQVDAVHGNRSRCGLVVIYPHSRTLTRPPECDRSVRHRNRVPPQANMWSWEPSPVRTVRAVLLDLDDTLIVEEAHAMAQVRATAGVAGVEPEAWERLVLETARSEWHASEHYPACKDLGIASWEGLWATFEGAHPLIAPLRGFVETYRRTTWSRALEQAGKNPELAPELSRMYVDGQRAGHPLAEGAADLVQRAVSIGPVGLVTNGPPDIQRLKLEQTGLADHFSAVVISGELGLGKPDRGIFLHALAALDVEPQAAVMVGDNWERDVEGALSAGLSAVWISHGREPPRAGRPRRRRPRSQRGHVRLIPFPAASLPATGAGTRDPCAPQWWIPRAGRS